MTETKQETQSQERLSQAEAAKLLWSEWEYRHSVFWNSLYRWGFSAVAVTIVPYIKPELINQLEFVVLFFPVLASFLAVFAAWHLGAEYIRLLKVSEKYKQLLGEYQPERFSKSNLMMEFFGLRIGWVVPGAFLFFAFIIETINIFVLISLM